MHLVIFLSLVWIDAIYQLINQLIYFIIIVIITIAIYFYEMVAMRIFITLNANISVIIFVSKKKTSYLSAVFSSKFVLWRKTCKNLLQIFLNYKIADLFYWMLFSSIFSFHHEDDMVLYNEVYNQNQFYRHTRITR